MHVESNGSRSTRQGRKMLDVKTNVIEGPRVRSMMQTVMITWCPISTRCVRDGLKMAQIGTPTDAIL